MCLHILLFLVIFLFNWECCKVIERQIILRFKRAWSISIALQLLIRNIMKAKERCLKWLEFHFQKEPLLFKSINVIFFANFLQSPGPGTYEIIDYGHIRNRGPSFSIHSRVEMPGDNTRKPGPGSHQPEKVRYPWLPTCYHGNISWIVRILLTYVAFLSYRLLRYSTALWS